MANKAPKNNETAVAVRGSFDVTESLGLLQEMHDNYGDLSFKFNKISFPSAGVPAFALDSDEGDPEFTKELIGIILFTRPYNCYYPDAYNGENNAPQCASYDDKVGHGSPGGDCKTCPLNKFGTGGIDGNGKACRNKRLVYFLREGELFPDMIEIPPTSRNRINDYITNSFLHRKPVEKAVTKIELKVSDKKTRAEFSRVRMLTPEEQQSVAMMAKLAKEYDEAMIASNMAAGQDMLVVDPDTGEVIEPLK